MLLEGSSNIKNKLLLICETVENEMRNDQFIQSLSQIEEKNKKKIKV
jgi:hypothetical protein